MHESTPRDPSATADRASPGKGSAASTGQTPGTGPSARTVYRKAAGGIGGAAAGAAVESAAQNSAGQSMDSSVRASMEGHFGRSFSDVSIHTDSAAAEASQTLQAKAFTTGRDIYFNSGNYQPDSNAGKSLLAHELAHVAQGGSGAQAKADGAVSVSQPGDAAEREADAASSAVMRGEPVGPLTSNTGGVVLRDALGDLDSTSQGNWLGSVDTDQALQQIQTLSAAEKQSLIDDETKHPTMRRLFSAFSTAQCLQVFYHVPQFDMRWRFYWLSQGGKLDDLSAEQWQWLIGYATPEAMEAVRRYPTGYRAFLRNAPAEMIPAWDKLQGLEDGNWTGSEVDVRNAVNQLNAAQQQRVRDDAGKMQVILANCGGAHEKYRTLQYLEVPCKWQVFWLNQAGVIGDLPRNDWAQMLTEATAQERAELVGWNAMYELVSQHCPAEILLIAQQQAQQADQRAGEQAAVAAGGDAPASPTPNTFDDPVQLNALFTSMGPSAFLSMATRNEGDIDANYAKIKAAAKVVPAVDGLELGAKMGVRTAGNLKKWLLSPSATDVADLTKMFERRFNLTLTGGGSYSNHPATTTWTKQGLIQMWNVCEALPPQAVEQNERMVYILRDQNRGPGSAYYAGPRQGAEGDVLMGYRNDAELGQSTAAPGTAMYPHETIYHAGGAGAGSAAVNMPRFNATLRHEIGHAVDAQLNLMSSWRRQAAAGAWQQYDSWEAFVDAIISAGGGMSGHGYANEALYRRAMIRACERGQSFSVALTALGGTAPAADPGGPVSAVWATDRYREPAGGGSGPWYSNKWVPQGGRNFQSAYGSTTSLYSFDAAARNQRMVTSYQWRAPGEWFAEVYQVYYAEQESDPNAPVGGRLRSKDSEAANMMHNIVDRGHSPQAMNGGSVAPAPGTSGGS